MAKSECRSQLNKSMDMCFGLIGKEPNKYILLVEFRFNYQNMKNLNKAELTGKVEGSKRHILKDNMLNQRRIYIYFPV